MTPTKLATAISTFRYDVNAWKPGQGPAGLAQPADQHQLRHRHMLIGTAPVPRSQKPKGRWIYSVGQTETWVQNICASIDPVESGAILRDYAIASRLNLASVMPNG